MRMITPHFSFEELTVSRHDLLNRPPSEWIWRLEKLAQKLEEARVILSEYLGTTCVLVVTYGYRSPQENELAGGSPTSAHCEALGADFIPKGIPLRKAWDVLRQHPTFMQDVDQLIIERGCIHIGLPIPRHGWKARRELRLDANAADGHRIYPLFGIWQAPGEVANA